ncbi:hypothetical protein SFC65_19370 [Priestia filamentosa]|uniref:hypothetical protein n=1 Tax=Priestia filamentosa TaxID=1402861 RepID=UPI0039825CDB
MKTIGTDEYYEKYKKEIERLTQDEPYISEQEYEARLKYWRDWLGQMSYAYEEGYRKGIQKAFRK